MANTFTGELWSQSHYAKGLGVNHIQLQSGDGLSRDPEKIVGGGNSGYQAIGLLYHFGVKRIVLLGFDMKPGHWHGKHPRPLSNHSPYHQWLQKFGLLAKELRREGVEVINCTPGSALAAFPKAKLEDVL